MVCYAYSSLNQIISWEASLSGIVRNQVTAASSIFQHEPLDLAPPEYKLGGYFNMYKILNITAFGFIFEIENKTAYYANGAYEIWLNGGYYAASDKNVVCVFSLKPDTGYHVELKGLGISFDVKTLKPSYLINIKDYNAAGNGADDDTSAINLAIYTAPAGATVYIPRGEYMVDQVLLKTGVDIYLEQGAVLRQNFDRNKLGVLKGYQKNYDHTETTINASWEGHPLDAFCALVYGKDAENVHIYGEGTLDGNGEAGGFWINHKIKNRAYRPKNIFLVDCKNIRVSGITSRNSASWNIHPFYCDNIKITGLTIESRPDSPNTDGLNPESSQHVDIIGCHFSVGDDCIAIKAGKYYMSQAHLRPTRKITVRNCLMEKGHGGVVIGSEMSCGVYDVLVTKCLFIETDRGLRIKTRRGRGSHAIVENIKYEHVIMDRVRHPFVINMFYHCDPDGKSDYVKSKEMREKDEYTPTVKNITVTDVKAAGIPGSAVFIYGLPENKVKGVTIKGCEFTFSDERVQECPAMMCDFEVIKNLGFYANNAEDIIFENNDIKGEHVRIGV
jgi:polygalacturonase